MLADRPPDRAGEFRALAETRTIVASAYRSAMAAASAGHIMPSDMERLRLTADLGRAPEQLPALERSSELTVDL